VVEDAISAHQRPKLETYGDDLFFVLKTARYLDTVEEVEFGEIAVYLAPQAVLYVRHGAAAAMGDVWHQLEARPELMQQGTASVLYAVVDHVVDAYEPVILGLEQDVREVEHKVFADRVGQNPVARIYGLMRTVLQLQDALAPLASPLGSLAARPMAAVPADLRPYFRDVQDHLTQVVQRVDTLHDLLANILAANLTRVSIQQNEDMRRISAWVAIAAVPTMIAGVYGMNFDNMPELHSEHGYFVVIGLMATVCVLLYLRLRKSGWL